MSEQKPNRMKEYKISDVLLLCLFGFSLLCSCQMPMVTSVEVIVPQILLPHVYGENKTNLGHILQVGLKSQLYVVVSGNAELISRSNQFWFGF